MSTPSRSARALASAFGRTLKPTTIAFDAAASMTSDSTMPPTPVWITLDRDLVVLDLPDLVHGGLDRALHVGLDDQVELLDRALLHLREQILEADGLAALGEHLGAQALGALLGDLARDALVLDDAAALAGGRRLVEAEDLDRHARPGVLDALAVVVVQRRTLPQASPATTASPTRSVPRWTSIVATGPRPTSRRDSMMTPLASARRVGLQLEHVGLRAASARAACRGSSWPWPRRRRRSCPPPHSSGCRPCVDELVAHPLGVRVGPVDLVHRDDDRHARRPWRGRSPRSSAA